MERSAPSTDRLGAGSGSGPPVEPAGQPGASPGDDFLFIRLIDRLSALSAILSALALLAMTGIVCHEVFARYVLNEPTYWGTEIATYILLGMIYVGLAPAQKSGSHIQVELVLSLLSPVRRQKVELVAHWVGLFFVTVTAWQMVAFTYQEYVNDTRDWGLLSTPQWIPETPVAAGLIVFALAILADVYRLRPPEGAVRRWSVPILFAIVAVALIPFGAFPVRIGSTPLDWGTICIAVVFVLSMLAWSGWATASIVTGIMVALGLSFWAARGMPLLPVGILFVVTMSFLLLLGVRISLALGMIGLFGLIFLMPQPQLSLLAERSWNSVNSFTLTAVPMFVLMGGLLLRSGVATEMFDALMRWFGRVPGGIAHATIGASGVFAAVSGSSLATAATMGTVAGPEMIRRGYHPRLAYGVIAAGGTLGILIPPSIAMIIYGTTVGAPITVLFIAGIVPGILLMLAFMAQVLLWSALIPGAAPAADSYSWAEKFRALTSVLPFGALIVAVLGSLYAGVATPTEAGGVGSAVALFLCLRRRMLTWKMLYDTAVETVRVTAFLLLIVVGASILSWVFDFLRIPRSMVDLVQAAELAPWLVMMLIALIYIVLGMFIDPISMMLMTLPVTFPIVTALGFDAVWFGIALVMMIEVGLITPPVGMILFVLRGMSGDVSLSEIVKGVMPFVGVILMFVVLIYIFPEIVSWLPSQME